MQRQRGELVPIGDALSGMGGPPTPRHRSAISRSRGSPRSVRSASTTVAGIDAAASSPGRLKKRALHGFPRVCEDRPSPPGTERREDQVPRLGGGTDHR